MVRASLQMNCICLDGKLGARPRFSAFSKEGELRGVTSVTRGLRSANGQQILLFLGNGLSADKLSRLCTGDDEGVLLSSRCWNYSLLLLELIFLLLLLEQFLLLFLFELMTRSHLVTAILSLLACLFSGSSELIGVYIPFSYATL